MRIAVVEPVGRGGLIHYAFQLSRGLAAAGAEVTLVTDRGNEVDALPRSFDLVPLLDLWDPKPEQTEPGAGSRIRRVRRGLRYLHQWGRLVTWLRNERFDVIQAGDVRFGLELPFLARLRRTDCILADVCHNVTPFTVRRGSFRSRGVDRMLYRWIYRQFDVVFVHFEENRERFVASYGASAERVEAIPMGNGSLFRELRDPSRTPAALRDEMGLSPTDPVVLLFGTLSRYKGVDLLLEEFPAVLEQVPEARLVVAGYPLPGFDLEEERARVEALGLGEAVRFVPRYLATDEVGAWMELADVCVFPYRELSQSAAVQVPLAFGVPVVATEVGAMREALVGGKAGLLVPPGRPGTLGRALVSLLADPAAARELGRRGAELGRDRGSWERIGKQVHDRYRELLEAREGHAAEGRQ